MAEPPAPRSVKIGADERTGWSSERPRREGAAPRPADISGRSRLLRPSDRLRYSPGSLLIVLGPQASKPEAFVERVLEDKGVILAPGKIRELIAGRVPAEALYARAGELLEVTVGKRLQAGHTVVVPLADFDVEPRDRLVRLAHAQRRPRHMLLLEAPREQVQDEERPALDELRRILDAGELGQQGFQTALRLGGNALTELKRIVFQPPPRDE
jgi:hypothetical protein